MGPGDGTAGLSDAPSYIQAAAAVVAAVGGVGIFAQSATDRHRAQSSKIYTEVREGYATLPNASTRASVVVVNPTDGPIYQVWATLLDQSPGWLRRRTRSHHRITRGSVTPIISQLAPGTESEEIPLEIVGVYHLIVPVFVEFTDADGRRWRRWPDGKLTRWRQHVKPTRIEGLSPEELAARGHAVVTDDAGSGRIDRHGQPGEGA